MLQSVYEKWGIVIPVPGTEGIKGIWIKGDAPGKTLVVTAGVHGCEYVGIQAVREIVTEINASELSGSVLFIPLINENGFYEGAKQIVPEDGENLNRCFPGDEKSSITWRTAKSLEEYLYKKADFLLDLHGGDVNESMTPLTFFPVGAGAEIEQKTREAAKRLSIEYRIQSRAENGLYSYAAKSNIPALLIERGGGGKWSTSEVEACKRNIYEIMDFLNIKEYEKNKKKSVEILHTSYEEAAEKGFWYCMKEAGEAVKEHELLGRLTDEAGETINEYRAEFDGVTLYLTHALGVRKGDPLIAYGKI